MKLEIDIQIKKVNVSSNIKEKSVAIRKKIEAIQQLQLVTDVDFDKAKKTVVELKTLEVKIKEKWENAVSKAKQFFLLEQEKDNLLCQVSKARLNLEKQTKRKREEKIDEMKINTQSACRGWEKVLPNFSELLEKCFKGRSSFSIIQGECNKLIKTTQQKIIERNNLIENNQGIISLFQKKNVGVPVANYDHLLDRTVGEINSFLQNCKLQYELAQKEKAEAEAREKAEAEAREKAEAEAREKAEAEAREKAGAEAREKAEAEAREKAGAKAREKAEAEERAIREEQEKAEKKSPDSKPELDQEKKNWIICMEFVAKTNHAHDIRNRKTLGIKNVSIKEK